MWAIVPLKIFDDAKKRLAAHASVDLVLAHVRDDARCALES